MYFEWDLVASGAGAFTDVTMTAADFRPIRGWFLSEVMALPTSGGTAPDEADVAVKNGTPAEDILDGGGTSLISATLRNTYSVDPPRAVVEAPVISISNNAAVDAEVTIGLMFKRK
jgi:hypothetical protein